MESSELRKKKEECWKLLCSGKRGAGVRQSHAIPNWPHYSHSCVCQLKNQDIGILVVYSLNTSQQLRKWFRGLLLPFCSIYSFASVNNYFAFLVILFVIFQLFSFVFDNARELNIINLNIYSAENTKDLKQLYIK